MSTHDAREERERIASPPERIWLQWYGDGDRMAFDEPSRHDDVTWCVDHIHEQDIEYLRADVERESIAGYLEAWAAECGERSRQQADPEEANEISQAACALNFAAREIRDGAHEVHAREES